jgi:hypothetical protein
MKLNWLKQVTEKKVFVTFAPGNIIFLRSDGVAKPLPAYEVTFCHYGLVQWG